MNRSGIGPGICISNRWQVTVLFVWGPHFENHGWRLYPPLARTRLSDFCHPGAHRVGTFTLALSPELSQPSELCINGRSPNTMENQVPTPNLWGRRDGAPSSTLSPTDSHVPGQESLPSFAWTSKEGLFAKCLHVLSSHRVSGAPGVAVTSRRLSYLGGDWY